MKRTKGELGHFFVHLIYLIVLLWLFLCHRLLIPSTASSSASKHMRAPSVDTCRHRYAKIQNKRVVWRVILPSSLPRDITWVMSLICMSLILNRYIVHNDNTHTNHIYDTLTLTMPGFEKGGHWCWCRCSISLVADRNWCVVHLLQWT